MVLIGPGALDGVDLEKKKFCCLIVVEIKRVTVDKFTINYGLRRLNQGAMETKG